jgi:hypothetical protein
MNAPLSDLLSATCGPAAWMQDRLTEARGILADVAQHPVSLVLLAARVVAGQSGDARECADAVDLLHLLDRHRWVAIAAAAPPNGGAS